MEGERLAKPRIRDITGIRIHQLTLPESLQYASKLVPPPADPAPVAGPSSPSASLHRTLSGSTHSRKERRISTSTLPDKLPRARSTSESTAGPPSPRARGRARAPTLAGEAILHAQDQDIQEADESQTGTRDELRSRRKLARCFVVLKLPRPPPRQPTPKHSLKRIDTRPKYSRASSSTSSNSSPPHSPKLRSPLGQSTFGNGDKSVPPPNRLVRSTSSGRDRPLNGSKEVPLARTISNPTQRRSHKLPSLPQTPETPSVESPSSPIVPFYISPIHHPSTHPRFLALSHETDFAPWMTIEESASHVLGIEVWYETPDGWMQLEEVSTEVDMGELRRSDGDAGMEDNTVSFTLESDPVGVYYLSRVSAKTLSEDGQPSSPNKGRKKRMSVRGVVERSMRETRMKKGVGVGGLHQLVNMQSVLIDTRRGIHEVQSNIDRMLQEDVDRRAIRRDVQERQEKCRWIQEKIEEVEKTTREVQAHITLRQQDLEARQRALSEAHDKAELLHGNNYELRDQIAVIDDEREDLVTKIHHHRMHHVQCLDALFPIVPLHPPSLLYSILSVPLPIPIGPKDPAPPLSFSKVLPEGTPKVDERTTAAALGYVAMVVQVLGNLGGPMGGLAYPITCAGSRSLVKDVVSVMQGPRSFPLYAKGVERYRYEYAVFLLNKNIEMLMQESNIRLLDIRHTLPNLKILLLTLSSPTPPSSTHLALSRSSTFVDSRTSSRQTSGAWPKPYGSPGGSSTGRQSPVRAATINTPSPLKRASITGRRSRLRRSIGGFNEIDLGTSDVSEDEMTVGEDEKENALGSPLATQPA